MLIAARSSQDFACCARATDRERLKYASAFGAPAPGDVSAISPAMRFTSASHHFSESTSSEPKGQEMNYAARVSLDRTQMRVEDKLVNLSPGMAVTVEIKTGTRRIISYLLSPVLRYKQEVLRER
jgi:hypothetical protein